MKHYNKLIECYKRLSKRFGTDRQERNDFNDMDRIYDMIEGLESVNPTLIRSDSPTQLDSGCDCCNFRYYN